MSQLIKDLQDHKGLMETERSSFEPHWREISKFISTRTSRYQREDRNRGGAMNNAIINETAVLAHRTLESGMMAGMSSPARPWFALGPQDPGMKKFGPVKEWLDDVTKIMLQAMGRSNLYSALPKQWGGIGGYGTAAFGLVDDEQEIFRAYPFPIGSFYIDTNERLQVDGCHREFSMTTRQLIGRFGKKNGTGQPDWSNFSVAVKNAFDAGKMSQWFGVNHAVEINPGADPRSLHSKHKKYRSVYYEDGPDMQQPLSIMGYSDFPVITSRWHVNGEDVYGSRSPAMDALGSTKMIQLEERRKYQIIDKVWNPAMNADATMRNSGADLLPGGMNWTQGMAANGNKGMSPAYTPDYNAIAVLQNDIKDVESRINSTFFADLMLMLATSDNSQMTAREVEERHSEKLLVLGPMLEQQNDDTFDPLIDTIFNKCQARGLFPPPPDELDGQVLRVEYISTMAQAQKLIGVTAVERFVGFVGNMAAIDPAAADKLNVDETIDEYGIMVGVSGSIVRDEDEVLELRQSRAQQLQAAQAAERMPALEQGAQAAKTLSEIPSGGENALTRMLSQAQGG